MTAPKAVNVTVNWDDVQVRATPYNYSLNGYSAVAPSIVSAPLYGKNMAYMNGGLIRFHYGNLMGDSARDIRGWVNVAERRWDRARIAAVMDAVKGWKETYGYSPDKLVTIPSWPAWMKTYSTTVTTPAGTKRTINGLLDPSEWDNYAAFCAELVRILNIEQCRGVKFFEATNERDDLYYIAFKNAGQSETRLGELIEIYNRAAVAMKAVDPGIQVGGPAFARGDQVDSVRQFVRGARQNLDFLSFHFYASGDLRQSDEQIYDRIDDLGRHTRDILQIIREESPGKPIPAHLNENNISYTFLNNDPRMQNHKGAVYDALSMISALDNGTAAHNPWNERDGIYGKMDGNSNLRVTGETSNLFNAYMVGDRVTTTTSNDRAVVPIAVKSLGGDVKAVALVNRSANRQRPALESVPGNHSFNPSSDFTLHRVSRAGRTTHTVSWGELESGRFFLPDHSVTVLVAEPKQP